MEPKIVKQKISEEELVAIEKESPGMIKLAVDIKKEILSLGCFLHIDCYEQLLEEGSRPENVWGANFYPKEKKIDFISLVNIRLPHNKSMDISDKEIRNRIEAIIKNLLI
ncbi:MAG: DUF5674 family protein [Patescibacteria group bacterium]|nr:DUF5674 family protein [Patescibacteria group bacterium]